jgi:glutathione S-transferase
VLATLEKAIAHGPFIPGERFSAADVYVGSQIGWGMRTSGIGPRPAFREYMARVAERPAFKRATAHDEQLAKRMP